MGARVQFTSVAELTAGSIEQFVDRTPSAILLFHSRPENEGPEFRERLRRLIVSRELDTAFALVRDPSVAIEGYSVVFEPTAVCLDGAEEAWRIQGVSRGCRLDIAGFFGAVEYRLGRK